MGVDYGLASNLKAMCRHDHLLKTFWGWKDQQLPDGTVIWTSPTGQTYVTAPGSAWLFPQLCTPTGELPEPAPAAADRCTDRAAMMPTRRRSRAENHARYIAAERSRNRRNRQARDAARPAEITPGVDNDEPPPF